MTDIIKNQEQHAHYQIFKSIFGDLWKTLPPVFHKRYTNRPYCTDKMTVEGLMEIHYANAMLCLIPFLKLLRILVPYKGSNIPVTVDFCSQADNAFVYLKRKFNFPGKPAYEYNSYVSIPNNKEVIEYMSYGIGWKTHYFYDGTKVVMQHKGYVWKIFGLNIPLPLEFLIGKGHAEEEPIDDDSYRVTMAVTHPFLGVMYRYSGNFTVKNIDEVK